MELVPTVDVKIEQEEVLGGTDMEELKKAKLLSVVFLVMVFVMTYLFFTDRLVVEVENLVMAL